MMPLTGFGLSVWVPIPGRRTAGTRNVANRAAWPTAPLFLPGVDRPKGEETTNGEATHGGAALRGRSIDGHLTHVLPPAQIRIFLAAPHGVAVANPSPRRPSVADQQAL